MIRSMLSLWRRLSALVFSGREDQATREEMELHLDLQTEKLVAEGMDPRAARAEAHRRFGSAGSWREQTREQRGVMWMEDLFRDTTIGLRQIARRPGFYLVFMLTVALGIGSVTAIWTVVDGVLLREPPVEQLDELVMLWQTDRNSGTTREPSSYPDIVDVIERLQGVDQVAVLSGREATLRTDSGSTRLGAMAVSANYFETLGVPLLLGRAFRADEDVPGGPAVAILGEDLWREAFAARGDVIGRRLEINDVEYEIVGVAPRAAQFGLDQIHGRAAYHSTYVGGTDIGAWLPLQVSVATTRRASHPFLAFGRLDSQTSLEDLSARAVTLAAELEREYPESNQNRGMFVEPMSEVVFSSVRPVLWLLLSVVGLLVAVAFVNVTNLLLARGTTRGADVALRRALGAGTLRIARQLVVENGIATGIGAVLGIGLAHGILALLLQFAPADAPRLGEVAIDARVLALTVGVTLFGALLFGLVPTLQAMRPSLPDAVGGRGRIGSGRESRRLRHGLIVAEIALSVAVLVCAGLMTRSLWKVVSVDPGFEARGVVKLQTQLPTSRYPRDFGTWPAWNEVHDFRSRLQTRLDSLPGVDATLAGAHPLDQGFTNSFDIVGREDEPANWPEMSVRGVAPNYFDVMGVELLEGRALEPSDGTEQPFAAVINRSAAEMLFDGPAVGQAIRFWGRERRIVGVVEDERIHGLTEAPPIAMYAPLAQLPSHAVVVLARSDRDLDGVAQEIASAIRATDPSLAVFGIEPLVETVAATQGERRFAMVVLVAMAAATLALALFGVYGMLSYTAAQRRQELGVRAALGATRGDLVGAILRTTVGLALIGVVMGLVLAAGGARLFRTLLFGVAAMDPVTYLGVAVLLVVLALIAGWVPAYRAARVEAVEALRLE